jgi:predicted nucleotidyltransferase
MGTPVDDPTRAIANAERCLALRGELLMEEPIPQPLSRPLFAAVSLFDELGIRYALIGGLASIIYGRARPTDDVDFVAATDHESVLATHPDAMRRHGFDPTCTLKLHHTSGASVDLWKDEFANGIVARATPVDIAGQSIDVIEPHDLVAMKLRADRAQDLYDISELLKRTPIDDDRIRSLVTPEQFEHFLFIKRRYGDK